MVAALWLVSGAVAAQQFSGWSNPVNLGVAVNSSSNEQHPALSPDGLSLYFSSDRPGGAGGSDLWVAHRSTRTSQWGIASVVAPLNSPSSEFAPAFDPSGRWLFFGSERDGGCGGRDVWVSFRTNTRSDLDWMIPVNLGCGRLSWPGFDDGPTYFQEEKTGIGTLYFISDRPGGLGGRDVWSASNRNGSAFGAPVNVTELNSSVDDARPAVRADGLEFLFTSARVGSVPLGTAPSTDIWVSTRQSATAPWPVPVNLGSVNTSATEGAPTLSLDGTTMIFNSNRADTVGGLDLYVTTRTR
jgi:Tol biopolymer transport system component